MVVPKKTAKLRLCLDPRDLNQAIQREYYPLPTIEGVAAGLHGARAFTILDARNGFWHVTLDEESSFLTTFNAPFGIKSASEVFKRKMHEVIEGLVQVEVVADDFVVVGRSITLEEATRDHDQKLIAFLQRCQERGLKLNSEKLMLR